MSEAGTTTRLLVLRHGQSTWNAERRWQGWADAPLSELGTQQALDAAGHLVHTGVTRAASSDLQRARRTAELIAGTLGLGEVTVVRDLRERDVGRYQGHTAEELCVKYPDDFDAEGRRLGYADGEDDEALCSRTVPALVELAGRRAGEVVLVVSHGGVIRALERRLGVGDAEDGTPNLGGRWFEVRDDELTAGAPLLPVDPSMATVPRVE